MPTQRRRIGFLPSSEVQNIIDKVCNHNKLSQSKVTGILVEEALRSRGVLNTSIKELSFKFCSNNDDSLSIPNKTFIGVELKDTICCLNCIHVDVLFAHYIL